MMKIAIIGASGSIGTALVSHLLRTTDHQLVLFSHHAKEDLHFQAEYKPRFRRIDGSVLKASAIDEALEGCDMAVYLVHLMGLGKNRHDFEDREVTAATNFGEAVRKHGIKRVIYVGGMGDEADKTGLTAHLASRRRSGDILRGLVPQLIEFRTPMVVGPGAAGFEVLRSMVERLHVLPVPTWAGGVTRPITLADVVRYISAALSLDASETKGHQIVPIGGPDDLSYAQVARRYAAFRGVRLVSFPLPLVPKALAAKILYLFKQQPYVVTVADMLESAGYSPHFDDAPARQLFSAIDPEPIEQAFALLDAK